MTRLYALHRVQLSDESQPLYAALAAAIPGLSRRIARRAILAGLVSSGSGAVRSPAETLPAGTTVVVDLRHGWRRAWRQLREGPSPPVEDLKILQRDQDVCIIDKPAGLPSVPPPGQRRMPHVGSALRRLLARQGAPAAYLGLVHRLDRDTSGCMVVACSLAAQRLLAAQFAGAAVERRYRCLVVGHPPAEQGVVRGRQGRGRDGRRSLVPDDQPGVPAQTQWQVLARWTGGCELELRLLTGRTHQARVAMADLGCPILGDRLYGRSVPGCRAERLFLHAATLAFDHPRHGRRLQATAPLPKAWGAGIAALGG
ncbi:MAG: RluA family pseudouridine synthase [Planctomycetota bacterium]|nr:RluA family pseudouridine synthase [Planctomycetota bacterium]